MACQISYDTIRDLFFKSLAFDKTTYSSYSNMVSSIMGMNIDSETKVHTIWYMGILYNQSIKHDDSIITEDLPLQVSALVVDKLNDDAADFEKLLEEVNQLFVPAAPVSDIEAKKADIKGRIAGQGTSIELEIKGKTGKEFLLVIDRNGKGKIELYSEKKEFPDGPRFSQGEGRTASQEQIKKLYDEYIPKNTQEAINNWLSSFTGSWAAPETQDGKNYNKAEKALAAELAALEGAKPAVTPTPKPITLNDKVKALVKKANSGKVADVESAILDFVKLSKSDIQANNDALKNAFNKDILDIINRKTTGSTRALLLSYLQTSLPAPKPEPVISTSFVDISEEPGLGKDFYVVRNEDGNLIETVFNSNDDTYYIYENIFEVITLKILNHML
jgi:hypothetical protein